MQSQKAVTAYFSSNQLLLTFEVQTVIMTNMTQTEKGTWRGMKGKKWGGVGFCDGVLGLILPATGSGLYSPPPPLPLPLPPHLYTALH